MSPLCTLALRKTTLVQVAKRKQGEIALIQCTYRESDVLMLLAQGLSNKAIAQHLGISPHTVRDHVCSLMQRYGVPNRVALAILANEREWQIGGKLCQPRIARQAEKPPSHHLFAMGEGGG